MDDPYSVLGLNRDASEREIKKKYQELVRKCHPDKLHPQATPTERTIATEEFHRLNSAYQLLTNEERRHHYDVIHKANEITEDYIINDTLSVPDMYYQNENEYMYKCRCGGVYCVGVSLVKESVEEGVADLIVPCSNCSLHVRIKL